MIDSVLESNARPAYKKNILIFCMSKQSMQTLLNMWLTADELDNHVTIIDLLKERCNAGWNRYVLRRQYALRTQRQGEVLDNCLCDLRDLAQKYNFGDHSATPFHAMRTILPGMKYFTVVDGQG